MSSTTAQRGCNGHPYRAGIWKYWDAFRERHERQELRATLSNLSDTELMDIGTTRGEIDYVASHRGIHPRGIDPANGSNTCQR